MKKNNGWKGPVAPEGPPVVIENGATSKGCKDVAPVGGVQGRSIGVAFYNINGLKTQFHRVDFLVSWAIEEKVDIIGIAGTNLGKREAKFMAKDLGNFRSFWSSASPDKLKGSGVGLLIHRNIEQHIGKIE